MGAQGRPVGAGAARHRIRTDLGTSRAGASAVPGGTAADGPECASVALGRVLAHRQTPLTTCPANRLAPADADALRRMVGFLADRGPASVVVLGDSSPRSRAAERLVRRTLTAAGVAVRTHPGTGAALVVVAGWSATATALPAVTADAATASSYPHGVWLAPWLLTAPVLATSTGIVTPLRYHPHTRRARTYAALVGTRFPGAVPSASGYEAWLAAQPGGGRTLTRTPPRLYVASRVSFLPEEFGHKHGQQDWFPGGTVVPASGPMP